MTRQHGEHGAGDRLDLAVIADERVGDAVPVAIVCPRKDAVPKQNAALDVLLRRAFAGKIPGSGRLPTKTAIVSHRVVYEVGR